MTKCLFAGSGLEQEIDGLQSLERHLAVEYERTKFAYDKSKQGLGKRLVGHMFAFYCILRIASVGSFIH